MRHALIRALLLHFAERAGYTGPLRVTTRLETFERVRRKRGYDGPANEHKDYASTLTGRPPVSWVNVARHRSLAELVNTTAHEAVHIADPALAHGAEFDRRVRRLVRGGRL